jgi:hypothetical protein
VLCPDEPLRHRRLSREERARDLGRGQAADQTQRERDLRLGRQGGVAAREDQREPLVCDRAHRFLLLGLRDELDESREPGLLRFQRPLPPQAVDREVARGRDDPRPGARRDAVAGPALRGDRERFLDGVLGEVEVTERADQDRDRAPELLPKCLRDRVDR